MSYNFSLNSSYLLQLEHASQYQNSDAILEIKYSEWIATEDLFYARRDLNCLPFYTPTEVTAENIKILSPMSGLKTHSAPISPMKL